MRWARVEGTESETTRFKTPSNGSQAILNASQGIELQLADGEDGSPLIPTSIQLCQVGITLRLWVWEWVALRRGQPKTAGGYSLSGRRRLRSPLWASTSIARRGTAARRQSQRRDASSSMMTLFPVSTRAAQ